MSAVQKYWTSCSDGWLTMEPSEKGTWVKLSDYQQLETDRDALQRALEDCQAQTLADLKSMANHQIPE